MIDRETLNQRVQHLLTLQQTKGYKKGWVWYKISTEAEFKDMTLDDVQYIGQQLGYKKGWAWHKYQEFAANKAEKTEKESQSNYRYYKSYSTEEFNEFVKQFFGLGNIDQELKTLGLQSPFDTQTLKKAYWTKAKETHPDTGGSSEEFRKVQLVYESLLKYASDYKAS